MMRRRTSIRQPNLLHGWPDRLETGMPLRAARSMRRGAPLAALCLGALALLGGCGTTAHVARSDTDRGTVSEQVSMARVTLAQLSASRFAEGAPIDIARAEQWLADLEGRLASGDADDETASLTVQVLRAQLSAIKSYYVRREAESALEDVRGDYAQRKTDLGALEDENMRLLESTGDLP